MTSFEYLVNLSPSGTLKSVEVARVVDTLRRGGLAVLPTETGYMLAADATSDRAVERAFLVKNRPLGNTMHIACSSLDMASRYGVLSLKAIRLLGDLTPGPISVIVESKPGELSQYVQLDGTVGLRIPDNPATLQILEALGRPVTATSLNESGSATIEVSSDQLKELNWPEREVVQVIDVGDTIPYPMASTLVRVTGAEIEILRRGPITESVVQEISGRMSYLEVADWT